VGKTLRVLAVVSGVVIAVYLVAATDNPLSRLYREREAKRFGFAPPSSRGSGAGQGALDAFASARSSCSEEIDRQLLEGRKACRRCRIEDCLVDAGRRYRAVSGGLLGQGTEKIPGP
jgi:hypothetical protein